MTKGVDKVFGLPSMEDVMKETDIDGNELTDEELAELSGMDVEEHEELNMLAPKPPANELITHADLKAGEHSRAMDLIHDDMLKHAADITELAFDLDPARAPRMLEVGAMYYKAAIDAKNSKRDAQLKLMKLIQDQRKLELDEAKFRHETGNMQSDKADVVMVEDRNAVLARLRAEAVEEAKQKTGNNETD